MATLLPALRTADSPGFTDELRQQRWDDHRYYHHSRINQSLHFFSANCFLMTYVLLMFGRVGIAAILGWVLAMWSRQIGHFFFEPKTYDQVNRATHEHKEAIKIGYNLTRKRVLLAIWAAVPLCFYFDPTLFGRYPAPDTNAELIQRIGWAWVILAVAALMFRTVQLFFVHSVQTGLVWATKILTDPFHDFAIYRKSPLLVLKGELLDPMHHVAAGGELPQSEDDSDSAVLQPRAS